jgi:hypothetical protein
LNLDKALLVNIIRVKNEYIPQKKKKEGLDILAQFSIIFQHAPPHCETPPPFSQLCAFKVAPKFFLLSWHGIEFNSLALLDQQGFFP